MPTPRRRLVTAALVAAPIALAAALGTAALADRIGDDEPESELDLRFPEDDDTATIEGEQVGKPVPDEAYTDADGASKTLADYRGRPLVVNFFASWCEPCGREMPDIERVHQDTGDEVAFLGIDLGEPPAVGLDLVARTGVTYDIGFDQPGRLSEAMGVVNMPSTFFVNARGRIVKAVAGPIEPDELRAGVEDLRA